MEENESFSGPHFVPFLDNTEEGISGHVLITQGPTLEELVIADVRIFAFRVSQD